MHEIYVTEQRLEISLGLWQMEGRTPQLPPDSDEHTLQLLSEAEQKLMLLKEELQGKDLTTILKEMEEEEVRNND